MIFFFFLSHFFSVSLIARERRKRKKLVLSSRNFGEAYGTISVRCFLKNRAIEAFFYFLKKCIFKLPLFIVSGLIFVMLPSSKLSSCNSTKSSAT